MNMNMEEKWAVFASYWKSRKTIAYVFNNVVLNWSINKEAKAIFGLHYIRVFCKIPALLWTTTVVHDMDVQHWQQQTIRTLSYTGDNHNTFSQ